MSAPIRTNSQDKKETIETFMKIGMVMLHLDARVPGVRVPPALQNEFQLRLNVSPRFDPPDLFMDEWGVRQTLSFQGRRFPVSIPWVAIFGLSSAAGEMRLYPHSVPDEIYESLAISQGRTKEELITEMSLRKRDDGTLPAECLTFCPPGVSPTVIGSSEAGARPAEADVRIAPAPDADAEGPRHRLIRKKGGLSLVVTDAPKDVPAPKDEPETAPKAPAKTKTRAKAKAAVRSKAASAPEDASPAKPSASKKRGASKGAAAADAEESASGAKSAKPRRSTGKKAAGTTRTRGKKAAEEDKTQAAKPPAPKPFKLHFVE